MNKIVANESRSLIIDDVMSKLEQPSLLLSPTQGKLLTTQNDSMLSNQSFTVGKPEFRKEARAPLEIGISGMGAPALPG